jgi:hypothetical protein
MRTTDVPHEVRHAGWNALVFKNLLDAFIIHSHELLWAIDSRKRIVLANEAYKRFAYQLTGQQVHIDDPVLPQLNDVEMTAKWDNFYTRALRGEKFNVITNYVSNFTPVMIDTSFIPICESDHIMGTACIARRSKIYDEFQLMSVDIPADMPRQYRA